jgi:hypothetical protein
MRDWTNNPVQEVTPQFIQAIRDNLEPIDPPDSNHVFVLRVGSTYFCGFHSMLPGPRVSLNVGKAAKLDNLVIVAAVTIFVRNDLPTLKERLFVEVVRKNGAPAKTPAPEKLKVKAVGV